jgi:hypothetical protein
MLLANKSCQGNGFMAYIANPYPGLEMESLISDLSRDDELQSGETDRRGTSPLVA